MTAFVLTLDTISASTPPTLNLQILPKPGCSVPVFLYSSQVSCSPAPVIVFPPFSPLVLDFFSEFSQVHC